ncbi:alpha/beta hydrolase [Taibaiella lutea]|uniref:Alpha/beta hydrolase n=1 Tax=Taibaiella lutea TaxID=2608001 RepID=A0A5M6CVP8_9BACT|nr:alpha/beta hydrolase [Taibaiella lutea]KAA5537299.1 alpha/beta hydrolase [Taibaiella lutea]
MNAKTYFIGGIATDGQLYRYQLEHIPNSVYLPFPRHDVYDTMETYVQKFIPLIDTSKPFNIAGCSMGGIMTMELLKHIHPEKVILISSVKCRKEMPWKLRQLKHTKLHRLFSGSMFIKSIEYGSRFIKEVNTTQHLREQIISMAKNNSPDFLYWCVNAIVNWNSNSDYRKDIIHIHGTNDKMFPIKNLKNVIPVEKGTHNMILSNPSYFTDFLLKTL